ncbi:MAG: ATP-binding cassette domain-containing protein [Kiritimatiellae bacterium]|nr:ATP-binding cassette domain-containing protein [Kiritimatiellia bacterium]MBR3777553.1 ATP-binding cassette domain-containing protein [Kiritimatiellia bacterium]
MALIEFKNVVKRFSGSPVLDDVSFSVEKGEVFCVIGPSGVGKSVTLKHIVRLLSPTSGEVVVDGVDVAACGEDELYKIRSRMAYLFQSGALLAWKTVAENVALPLKECTSLTDDEIDAKVAEALEAVELSGAADKYPSEISGGMQKRAALARAMVRQAEIVLYDEPTSGLDPVTSVMIHRLIKKFNKERGVTSVVVTHDLAGAMSIADRLLLLRNARVAFFGTPREFFDSTDPYAMEYIAATKGTTI